MIAAGRGRFAYAPENAAAAPVVSIVTPFHDAGESFEATIASVLGQSLQAFEWILVDDASTDLASLRMLEALAARDSRVHVVRHAGNRGRSAARNTGFRAARTDLVFVLDQDDLLEPTALEKCAWALCTRPEWGFVNGWCNGFGAQTYTWRRGFEEGAGFLHENAASGRALVRRSVFEAAGGYDESMRDGFEDWDFWLRCASHGHWGGTLPEVLDWFRRKQPAAAWEAPEAVVDARERLRSRHAHLFARFPAASAVSDPPFASLEPMAPFANPLARQRPRALLVLPWFTLGGADRFNLDLAQGLAQRGFEITIATTLAGDHSWEPAFAAVTPDRFALGRLVPLRDRPRFLRHLIESRRPDFVLISNSELGYLLLPWLRAHCPEPTYIDFCHMEQPEWKSGGYPQLSLQAAASLDATLVSSRHLCEWMRERGADAGRICVVPTGIDATRWSRDPEARERLRSEWGVRPDEAVLLFAGRLCAQKQPQLLLRTLAILAGRGIALRAIVAGDGPLRAEVEREAARIPAPVRVATLGAVEPGAMPAILSAADLFFLPSQMEGIALSLFEAMAMQVPVVAADVGGQRELVTPDTGVLIAPSGDPERDAIGYADALEALLRDTPRRRALGAAARERVRTVFDAGATLDALLAAFETARAQRRDGPALPLELANRIATQAIEFLRMQDESGSLGGRLAQAEAARARDAERLARLDGSRTLRWLRRVKRTAPYRFWARWRWGADWERSAP